MENSIKLRRAFYRAVSAVKQAGIEWGYPGRANADGTYTFDVPGKEGMIYVRIWKTNGVETLAEAINMGSVLDPRIRIYLEYEDGVRVVRGPHAESARQLYGKNASHASVPPHLQTIGSGSEDFVESERFVPGRLLAHASAPAIAVEPYTHAFGAFTERTEVDLSALVSALTAGQQVMAYIVANELTGTISASASAVQQAASSAALRTRYDLLINYKQTLPYGHTLLGAVVLSAGASRTFQEDVIDWRMFINTNEPRSNYSALTAPGITDDVNSGYAVGSLWIDTIGNRSYICRSATAAAAVWAQIDSVGGGSGTAGSKARRVGYEWKQTLTAPAAIFDFNLSSLPLTLSEWDDIEITGSLRSAAAGNSVGVHIRLNNDTVNANYRHAYRFGGTLSVDTGVGNTPLIMFCPANNAGANRFSAFRIFVPNMNGSQEKTAISSAGYRHLGDNIFSENATVTWSNTAAITRVGLVASGGQSFVTGSSVTLTLWRNENIGGLTTSSANVSSPPTAAQLSATFGAPAVVGNGFMGTINDDNADLAQWLVISNGVSWWYAGLIKAI